MNRTRTMCATLLALSTAGVASTAGTAGAAGPCKGGDTLIAVTDATASYDTNANGYVCEHTKTYHAPKKPGPPGTVTTYYDDTV